MSISINLKKKTNISDLYQNLTYIYDVESEGRNEVMVLKDSVFAVCGKHFVCY